MHTLTVQTRLTFGDRVRFDSRMQNCSGYGKVFAITVGGDGLLEYMIQIDRGGYSDVQAGIREDEIAVLGISDETAESPSLHDGVAPDSRGREPIGMSYRDFTLKLVEQRFGLSVTESPDLFAHAPEAAPSRKLLELYAETVPLAIDINTEKARSELIIAPLLLEVRALLDRKISLFSGVTFDVDPKQGLNGVCDFLLSRSPKQFYVSAPVVVITEAKNEDMKRGIGQCLAAMLGARLFNEREGRAVETVFGAVTTGTAWRFLRLDGGAVAIDGREYHLNERLDKILGIFVQMFPAEDARATAGRPPVGGRPTEDY